jgi:hypothetical protein
MGEMTLTTGLSHAQAWLTIAKVNSSVSGTGDRVFFLGGDSWLNEIIDIDWTNATVGGYYWTGSSVLIGTNLPGGYVRPVIEGTMCTVCGMRWCFKRMVFQTVLIKGLLMVNSVGNSHYTRCAYF